MPKSKSPPAIRYYKVSEHKPMITNWGVFISRRVPDYTGSTLTPALARDILYQCGIGTGWVADWTNPCFGSSGWVVAYRVYENTARRVEFWYDANAEEMSINERYYAHKTQEITNE